jgi:hypothetical protein
VYLKVLVLKHDTLFRVAMRLGRPWVRLPGRGREGMASARNSEDLVRMYDGVNKPLGKAFTRGEVHAMLGQCFDVLQERRYALSRRRALPFPVSDGVYRWLMKTFGLMIVLRCRRREDT